MQHRYERRDEMLYQLNAEAPSDLVITDRFAGLGGVHYGGGDDRPPLLLLHRLTFDCTMWAPSLEELSRLSPRREVLALDLPGHGDSVRHERYPLEEVAEHVHAAVTACGIAAPVVVGHSVSGVVATLYAGRYPTARVVNVDQTLLVKPFAEAVRAAIGRGMSYNELWAANKSSMGLETLPDSAQKLLNTTSSPRLDLLSGYWRDIFERTPDELQQMINETASEITERSIPYNAIVGGIIDPSYAEWLRHALPQIEIDEFEGAGHFPHLADPPRFARLLAKT
jgi:pimeloyl-ACP methyl ester carboxylesterase